MLGSTFHFWFHLLEVFLPQWSVTSGSVHSPGPPKERGISLSIFTEKELQIHKDKPFPGGHTARGRTPPTDPNSDTPGSRKMLREYLSDVFLTLILALGERRDTVVFDLSNYLTSPVLIS